MRRINVHYWEAMPECTCSHACVQSRGLTVFRAAVAVHGDGKGIKGFRLGAHE